MCLDTVDKLGDGTSTEWIPAWKEVRRIPHCDITKTAYRYEPLARRMVIPKGPYIGTPYGVKYPRGFHAWLETPPKHKRAYKSRLIRCFIRKMTAVGTQLNTRAVVGLEIFIPSLKMDGTKKKQGNPGRKE